MRHLAIGDTSKFLYQKTMDKWGHRLGDATLITTANFSTDLPDGIYITSVGDIGFNGVAELAFAFDTVEFVTGLPWDNAEEYEVCKYLCRYLTHFIDIEGFPKAQESKIYIDVPVTRQHEGPTLWSFGCSTTRGAGIEHQSQIFGSLVAEKFGLQWQNIAKDSTSAEWAQSHIFQADFKEGDRVIIGFTSVERIRRCLSHTATTNILLSREGDPHEIKYFTDEQLYFEYVMCVERTVKYLRAKKIPFVFSTLLHQSPIIRIVQHQTSKYPEWCPVEGWGAIDLGTDNLHIGPGGHKFIAEKMYEHFLNLEKHGYQPYLS